MGMTRRVWGDKSLRVNEVDAGDCEGCEIVVTCSGRDGSFRRV